MCTQDSIILYELQMLCKKQKEKAKLFAHVCKLRFSSAETAELSLSVWIGSKSTYRFITIGVQRQNQHRAQQTRLFGFHKGQV